MPSLGFGTSPNTQSPLDTDNQFFYRTGNAMVLLSTAIASNSATIDFTGLNNTYTTYIIYCNNVLPQTDGAAFWVRVGTGVTPTYITTNDYRYDNNVTSYTTSATSNSSGSSSDSKLVLVGMGNLSQYSFDAVFTISNPSQTSSYHNIFYTGQQYYHAVPQTNTITGGGAYLSTTAITAIRIQASTGNINGTFKIYGIK